MNAYAAVILAILIGEFALECAADALNVRALGRPVPPELAALYDGDRLHRVRAYTRARTRFGLVVRTLDLAALLAFWAAGGFAVLDRWTRGLALGPLATGLAFIGVLAVARALLGLPLRWWSTFVVEERFGFNRTTPATFWADTAKGAALAVALGTPLVAALLWFFLHAGAHAWLWAWLATTLFALAVQLVAPTWILPLFNRFTPLDDGPLRDAIVAYAGSVGFPLEGVFVIDGSRRSTKANAFFTGFGRRKRIALFDTLVRLLETDELVGVLAHEIGHYKRRHVVKGTVLGVAQMGAMLALLSVFLTAPGLFHAFGVAEPSVHAGLVFFALLATPLNLVLSLAGHMLSRRWEREADAFALRTTGAGTRLATALEKLAAETLANPTPHPLHVFLHYSHPPVGERVRALAGA